MERKSKINNSFYDTLGSLWYEGDNHPIALLRAESRITTPWILTEIGKVFKEKKCRVLDIACGGGFHANSLAKKGYQVTGLDISKESLNIAKQYDETKTVDYIVGDACSLPFEAESFDVVSAMDFLEHTEQQEEVVKEAGRVLKKGGIFLFHTFNRNLLSYLFVIKGVEWSIKNAPPNLHTFDLFIKPQEVKKLCEKAGLTIESFLGMAPKVKSTAFWKMLLTRRVPPSFSFKHTPSLSLGYLGTATK